MFLREKVAIEAVNSRKGINLDAYFNFLRFTNHVKIKTTNSNFENCLIVCDFLKVTNQMLVKFVPENANKKWLHVNHEADRSFPDFDLIYSIE